MYLRTLHDHLTSSLTTILAPPTSDDALLACPASVLLVLSTHPESLIRLARSKLYTWPYAQVPDCWRRLFTDTSIVCAIHLIQNKTQSALAQVKDCQDEKTALDIHNGIGALKRRCDGLLKSESWDSGQEVWVQDAVNLLDMAMIMAGAEHRRDMIEAIVEHLRLYLEHVRNVNWCKYEGEEPPRKRWRPSVGNAQYNDTFPINRTENHLSFSIQHRVPPATGLSISAFENHLQGRKGPLVIHGALEHWPALHERPWRSPSYLMEKTFGGRRLVPVEVGRSYTDEGWGQKVIRFGDFMDEFILRANHGKGPSVNVPNEHGEENKSNTWRLKHHTKKEIGYLAQHDLFSQVPSLRNDISIPDYCFSDPPPRSVTDEAKGKEPPPKLPEPLLNAWFGPAGTISPLHTDPYHNILCQVVGKKYVRLYDPDQTEKLYPRGTDGGVDMSNTSNLDVEGNTDELDRDFPLFKDARYAEAVLDEGESLYIPAGWWHYVRSLTVSFSVSFWWN